jgi:hypothetical protein
MLGGMTSLSDEPRTPRADLKVALAGPATSVGCAVVAGFAAVVVAIASGPKLAVAGLSWLAVVNVTLAAFNLIPGAPLDGGRVLRAVLWRRTGDRRSAEQSAARAGRVTGGILVGLGALDLLAANDLVGALWLAAIGWFISTAARTEGDAAQTQDLLRVVSVAEATDRSVPVLRGYQSCAVAARRAVAANADYAVVETFDGGLVGVVDVAELVKAARDHSFDTCGDHARRMPPTALAPLDASLQAALRANGQRLPLVAMDGETIAGLVTAASLTHALRRNLLDEPYVEAPPPRAMAG